MATEISPELLKAKMDGERTRVLENIAARKELPSKQWWLSFADDDGFRGAVIVHANEFVEAVMEANLYQINPHGECQGMEVPEGKVVPREWTYRLLDRATCEEFDRTMMAKEE